jgi:hypothetical protein
LVDEELVALLTMVGAIRVIDVPLFMAQKALRSASPVMVKLGEVRVVLPLASAYAAVPVPQLPVYGSVDVLVDESPPPPPQPARRRRRPQTASGGRDFRSMDVPSVG